MANNIRRPLQYVLGAFMVSFGVVTLLRTNIGAGAWDTVNANLSALTGITLGTASFLVQGLLVLMIMLYRKEVKYILISVSIILIAIGIDFWDILIYGDYFYQGLAVRFAVFFGGVFVLTAGLSLIILTHYPAAIFDEFMMMVMHIFHTEKIFFPRLFVEMLAIVLASGFGFLAGVGFGAVNVGSVILAVVLPFILSVQLSWMRPLFDVKV